MDMGAMVMVGSSGVDSGFLAATFYLDVMERLELFNEALSQCRIVVGDVDSVTVDSTIFVNAADDSVAGW